MNSMYQAKLLDRWSFRAAPLAVAAMLLFAALPAAAQKPPAAGAAPTMESVARPAPPAMSIQDALAFTKKSPKDTNAWLALGAAYRRAHKYDEAA
ncbi:MAG TPA: hypothetical protein VFU59_08695, partial [Candidatus Eisenbacteria bacterium]|nr:hypothetical protein [Candidatus Eisenbacteria bacterium]